MDFLDSKVKSFKNIDEVYCAQGMNKPNSFNYNLYQQNLEDLNNVTAEYNKRKSEVDSATDVYNSIIAERNAVQSQLDMDKWFTKDEWKTLDSYVVEETYSNDNYITTDNTTDTERFDIERQLFDVAWKDLSKKCRPQYQYSSTLSNVLTIPQFKGFLKYFQLGNFIRMATDYDTVIKLRLISFTVDYNDTSKIDVTFSDAIRVHGVCNDVASIISQANSAAMSFQFNKDQYDKSVNQSNFVEEMRKYGLDVANIPVKNQHQSWDETGMWFRQWNEQKNDFDPEQIKIINNQIVFSDDGFQSAKMAIGKIPIDKNGNTVYAVNAEAILGKLFLGEYLTLQNNSGTYKFDDAGFIAKSGNNSVRIQPNQSEELFSIYKGNNKQFYVDSDGNVHFMGDLTGSSGIFSGQLKGGSINLGNGTFTVDKDGNLTANKGTFSGDLIGGSININNGNFLVDKYGNMKANAGLIGDWGITNGYLWYDGDYGTSIISPSLIQLLSNGNNDGTIISNNSIFSNSMNCNYINGSNELNIQSNVINLKGIIFANGEQLITSSSLPKSTKDIEASYSVAVGTYGGGSRLIDFSNYSSGILTGATPDYVQTYVNEYVADKLSEVYRKMVTASDLSGYATKSWCNSTFKKK